MSYFMIWYVTLTVCAFHQWERFHSEIVDLVQSSITHTPPLMKQLISSVHKKVCNGHGLYSISSGLSTTQTTVMVPFCWLKQIYLMAFINCTSLRQVHFNWLCPSLRLPTNLLSSLSPLDSQWAGRSHLLHFTIADIANAQLEESMIMPPPHPLEPIASSPVPLLPSQHDRFPFKEAGPLRPPLAYIDVYLDDFIQVVQGWYNAIRT